MIGFAILMALAFMIFMLIFNGLFTKEVDGSDEEFPSVDVVIVPDSVNGNFTEAWVESLKNFRSPPGKIRIHGIASRGAVDWAMLQQRFPYVSTHPSIDEANLQESVRLRVRENLVPSENTIKAMARATHANPIPLIFLPQTSKASILGEAIESLNPGLALASTYRFKKRGLHSTHPLMILTEGWMGMPKSGHIDKLGVAFAGKGLLKTYPKDSGAHFQRSVNWWREILEKQDKTPAALYFIILLIWASPILLYPFKPIWAMASLLLVMAYRFFTKIVFQESWTVFFLHPVAVFFQIAAGIRALGLFRKNV